MSGPILFLHDHTMEKERVEEMLAKIETFCREPAERHIFKKRKTAFSEGTMLFVAVRDEEFVEWLSHIAEKDVTIVPLPYEANPLQRKVYEIPDSVEEALELGMDEKNHRTSRMLRCQGDAVLGCITVGESEWVKVRDEKPLWSRVGSLFSLRLHPYDITTQKGQTVKTAALLLEISGESEMTRERTYYFKESDNQCQRVAAIVYAPQSIVETMRLRLLLTRKKRNPGENLPPGIGTVKSKSLKITTPESRPIPVVFNDVKREVSEVTIVSVPTKARIVTGWKGCVSGEEKESLRIQNLPAEEDLIGFFTKKSLPFIPIAAESAFAELFTKLRDSARMKNAYLLLLIISVLMATTGLFQNSSPTIIGAMILAPLMAPIVAFSMGAIRFDETLLNRSAKTILLSTLIALGASAFVAGSLPFSHLTEQMDLRTHPTLLDLAVAIFAGVAAAYGYINTKVGESLAGVAIAVALVPPLCVSGIGIGWGSWHIFANAFLLYLTNIIGILFAAGTTFYLMGYASRKYISAAFMLKLLMLCLIILPLWLSTRSLILEQRIYREVAEYQNLPVGGRPVQIHLTKVQYRPTGLQIHVTVTTLGTLNEEEKREIADILRKKIGKKIKLVMEYREMF
ncbi:TIGR00341 family protein [Hydrogenimonas cancrithermarum]|uniref:TIGR00341 family protein n=1 Tax=Hydrogenimonas cancrithermarum TaxID=2993563 RepID=A0ABN6WSJ9_9BACT|nr:TIGR00341 family protein [Hydrogenimonas cancrithermarum]BDY11774.1 hypothetical protein HCR_00860 [Hydrogenimonas cancrithermarum]